MSTLDIVKDSIGYRFIRFFIAKIDHVFPDGTKRGELKKLIVKNIGNASSFRFISLVQMAWERLKRDEQYQLWLKNNELIEEKLLQMQVEVPSFRYLPMISIVMPVYNTEKEWLQLAIDSVMNQVYSKWELCIVDDMSTKEHTREILEKYSAKDDRIRVKYLRENRGIAGASNEALVMTSGDFVGFLDHDDELSRDALFEVVKVLNQDPSLDLIYSDQDKKDPNGRRVEPFFKPDWSPDLLLSMNYVCHFTVVRKSLIDKVGGFRLGFEGSQDYDLILRVTELTAKIGHIPKPLYSWRKVPGSAAASMENKPYARESAKRALREALNRGRIMGTVTDGFLLGYYRVKYAIRGEPSVSIIIPARNRLDLLKRCIESIESNTSYKNYEIVVVNDNTTDSATLGYLKAVKHTVVKFNEAFNFSRINNFAVKYASGEHLLFLSNDVEVADEYWLEAMIEHSQRPEVGVVGGLLLYPKRPSGSASHIPRAIQHAGVIIGIGIARNAFKGLNYNHPNYLGLHRVIRDCSAVTADCAMIKRRIFNEVGGFDENLKVAFGDTDLCLRVEERGYRVVYTPYALLYHDEGASGGRLHPPEDEAYMIDRWKDIIIKGDPYYNPNLALLKEDYSISSKGSDIRPLAVLFDIYDLTPGLQRSYPEVCNGDYSRLIDWAATNGMTIDSARAALRPYGSYYASNASDRVKPLATLIDLYNSRVDLQRKHPEVLKGEFRPLITWANEMLAENPEDEAYAILKPYEARYISP